MFTGIVQAVGVIDSFAQGRLVIRAPDLADWEPWKLGESVAVDGCCLTVVGSSDGLLAFDVSEETLRRTRFSVLESLHRVNLERAMRPSDRFGGHIVQGHVDAVGHVESMEDLGGSWTFRFRVPHDQYLIDKGSIAINGVSLTVVAPHDGAFAVAVIPHTFSATTLGDLQPGDPVNVEYDVIAKHVERLLNR